MKNERGFTLVELLVSATITLAIASALLVAMQPADGVFSTALETADEQQRLRVATSVVARDLVMAGTGLEATDSGAPVMVASIMPFRRARTGGDPPGTFRSEVITAIYAPSWSQTTLATALPAQSASVRVNVGAGCPLNDSVCGLSRASTVLVFDDTGSADVFHVDDVQDTIVVLQHTMTDSTKVYAPGNRIVEAVVRSYFLKADPAGDTVQLVRDDGDGSPSVPVVDHVVSLSFDYFGSSAGGLQPLASSVLSDGPWRPDAAAPNRFDADLLRVRTVAVTIRVEAALSALRGPAGPLFMRGGTSQRGSRFLPDVQLRLYVSPRNIGNPL